jgi:hypothetical protein
LDEDNAVFKKPARKKMVSSDENDAKEALNCMKTVTEVVSKCDEFSVMENMLQTSYKIVEDLT